MPAARQPGRQLPGGRQHLVGLLAAADRDDHHLVGGEQRRQDEALVVPVRHDHSADHAGAHAPRGGVAQPELAALRGVLDAEGPGEVRAHVVRRAGLQRPPVAHHRLDRVGPLGAGEPLARRLLARDHRHGGHVPGHLLVEIEREQGLPHGVRLIGVRGVTLLPQELGGAQEHPRPQLPADHVGPLVEQHRQVPVRADPLGHHLADDRLRGRPDDQRLLELLAAGVGDHRQLRRETLDVLGLALQVALRDQQREVGVDVTGLLDPPVDVGLQQLPHPVSVRADHHRAPDRAAVDQLGLEDDLVVPGGEVLALRGHSAFIVRHTQRIGDRARRRPLVFACSGALAAWLARLGGPR